MREKKTLFSQATLSNSLFQMMFNFQFIIALAAEFGHCI